MLPFAGPFLGSVNKSFEIPFFSPVLPFTFTRWISFSKPVLVSLMCWLRRVVENVTVVVVVNATGLGLGLLLLRLLL